MLDQLLITKHSQLRTAMALLIGAGVPLMMFGRAVMQADLALALLLSLTIAFLTPGTYAQATNAGTKLFRGLLILLIIAWLPSMLESVEPFRSFKAWSRTFAFIGGAAVIWAVLKPDTNARIFSLKSLIAVALVTTTLSCISLLAWPELMKFLRNQDDVFLRPDLWLKSFAASAMCLFPVLIWAGRKIGGTWNWAAIVSSILCLVIIFETANRASIAGLMSMILIGAILLGLREKRTRLPLLVGAPIVVALMFWWMFNYGPTFLNHPDAYLPTTLVDPHRQAIWKFTFERALHAPWFGHGIDTINFQPGADSAFTKGYVQMIPSHPHNWVIEIFSETGAIGIVSIFTVLIGLALGLARSVLANRDTSENLALLSLSAGFWTSALFNFSIWSTWWLLTYFILYAIVASWRTQTD